HIRATRSVRTDEGIRAPSNRRFISFWLQLFWQSCLHRIQDDNLSSRLVAQIVDELIDLFGDFLFGQIVFDSIASLIEREDDLAAITQPPIFLFIAIRNFPGAHQREGAKTKGQISLYRDPVAQDSIQLL